MRLNHVKLEPIKFDPVLNICSLFDFDHNIQYRIMVIIHIQFWMDNNIQYPTMGISFIPFIPFHFQFKWSNTEIHVNFWRFLLLTFFSHMFYVECSRLFFNQMKPKSNFKQNSLTSLSSESIELKPLSKKSKFWLDDWSGQKCIKYVVGSFAQEYAKFAMQTTILIPNESS